MLDYSTIKLGRKAIKTDTRTLRMANYLAPGLPPPPMGVNWTRGVTSWGMMANDTLGDCTIAGVGHAVQTWSLNTTGTMWTAPDSTVEKYYGLWDGYVAGDPSTDNGGVELDVLNLWRKQGFEGHDLLAFVDPDVRNLTEIQQSIYLFGGVYIGISLPLTAQTQHVWDVVPDDGSGSSDPGSWGGHCAWVPQYLTGKRLGILQTTFVCVTWGGLQEMTTAFWHKYVDEAHTLLGQNWISSKGSPAGFSLSACTADLALIR